MFVVCDRTKYWVRSDPGIAGQSLTFEVDFSRTGNFYYFYFKEIHELFLNNALIKLNVNYSFKKMSIIH